MISLVVWLFFETHLAVKRECLAVKHAKWRERCTYAVFSTFFALSYVGRFFINDFDSCGVKIGSSFAQEMTFVTVWLLEGASMGVLMAFHFVNF